MSTNFWNQFTSHTSSALALKQARGVWPSLCAENISPTHYELFSENTEIAVATLLQFADGWRVVRPDLI
jgi:hypothetical protein